MSNQGHVYENHLHEGISQMRPLQLTPIKITICYRFRNLS